MKQTLIAVSILCLFLSAAGGNLLAQEPSGPDSQEQAPQETTPARYEDFTVKAYTLEVYGGYFSGGMYLDNRPLGPRTIITEGGAPIFAYDPNGPMSDADGVHIYSNNRFYDAAQKEIKSGHAMGARIGVYISDDFHLDLLGAYASGQAVTTMLYNQDPDNPNSVAKRITVDTDNGFAVYKGGLALMYDARPATFMGLMPRLGFGLGGIINRYSYLEDKTGLYLEGNFGLTARLTRSVEVTGQLDLATFAYKVDELGYSNIVSYSNFTLGLKWLVDVLPPQVRASHEAAKKR